MNFYYILEAENTEFDLKSYVQFNLRVSAKIVGRHLHIREPIEISHFDAKL